MKRELHTAYPFALQDGTTQAFAIDWLVGKSDRLPHRWQELGIIRDPMQCLDLLSQVIITAYKEQARMGTRREAGGHRFWIEKQAEAFLWNHFDVIENLGIMSTPPDLTIFPSGSWAAQVYFTLRKPYISRDDVDFYIIDNPVKKEWVFKVPYVAPSQWKGALRAAMIRELVSKLESGKISEEKFLEERLRSYRLFGNEKDGTEEFLNRILALHHIGPMPEDEDKKAEWKKKLKKEILSVGKEFEKKLRENRYFIGNVEGYQGYLYFFPTYFKRIGLEVINPHNRDTGTGKQPIYFECVPANTSGAFTLLYVPMDGADEAIAEADLKAVACGARAMLTEYGFGAKTSSGYGVADVNREKSIIKAKGISDAEKIFWKAF